METTEPQHTVCFSSEISNAAPALEVFLMEANVQNPPTPDSLWAEIEAEEKRIQALYPMDRIRHRPAIDATRNAYKALGKEPNRYRPSAEALCRRAAKGEDLYRTLAVIDLVNLASLRTGHSIGAFDADHIEGDTLTLGSGAPDEPYEAIGRGMLNIENLPVFRDNAGGIGTPTSDNQRTRLRPETTRLLITLNCYGPSDITEDPADLLTALLRKYASATDIRVKKWKVAGS